MTCLSLLNSVTKPNSIVKQGWISIDDENREFCNKTKSNEYQKGALPGAHCFELKG